MAQSSIFAGFARAKALSAAEGPRPAKPTETDEAEAERLKREAESSANAKAKRLAEELAAKTRYNASRKARRAADAKPAGTTIVIPRDAQTSLNSSAMKGYKRDFRFLDVTSPHAKSLIATGYASCELCPSDDFIARRDSIRSHMRGKGHVKRENALVGTATGSHDASLVSNIIIKRSSAAHTDKKWRLVLRRYTVARMVAGGIVPHKLDTVMKPLRPAFAAVKSLGSADQARKVHIPTVVKEIEDTLTEVLAATPAVVLMMDGGDVKFGDGQAGKLSIYDIFAYSAYLPRPLLLESLTVRTGPDGGTDSDEISNMLKTVQEKYGLTAWKKGTPASSGIPSGTVLGVGTDNASVMRKGAEKAGLFRFACAAHIGNLVVEAMLVELQLCDLLDDFNTYFSPAAGLVEAAEAVGIKANQLRSADYKFAYALPVINHTLERYDDIKAFVDTHLPRGVEEQEKKDIAAAKREAAASKKAREAAAAAASSSAAKRQKSDSIAVPAVAGGAGKAAEKKAVAAAAPMEHVAAGESPVVAGNVIGRHEVYSVSVVHLAVPDHDGSDATPVVRRNRSISTQRLRGAFRAPDLQVRLMLFKYHADDAAAVIKAAEGNPDTLPHNFVASLEALQTKQTTGHDDSEPIVDEFIKEAGAALTSTQRQHLLNDVYRGIEAAWPKWEHMNHCLPYFRRRELWHPANRPPATAAEVRHAAGDLWNSFVASDLEREALKYSAAWATERWAAIVRPANLGPAEDGTGPGVWVDPISFWNRDDVRKEFPRVRKVALHYLSVPLSTACVERSFSGLGDMEDPNRLSMLDESVRAEHFVQAHKLTVEEMLEKRLAAYRTAKAATAVDTGSKAPLLAAGGAGASAASVASVTATAAAEVDSASTSYLSSQLHAASGTSGVAGSLDHIAGVKRAREMGARSQTSGVYESKSDSELDSSDSEEDSE